MGNEVLIVETAAFRVAKNKQGEDVAWLTMSDEKGKQHCIGMLFGLEREFLEETAQSAVNGIRVLDNPT